MWHSKEGVSIDILQGLLDRQIATTPDWEALPSIEIIGIDEITLKKGHRDFIAIVTGQSGDQTHIRMINIAEMVANAL